MKTGIVSIVLLTTVLASCVCAEEIELKKIVVTPSGVEESVADSSRVVDVITAGEIQNSGVSDISEALTSLTSVDISDYGGEAGTKNIRMRGSTAAQVLILMDGRPINNPRDGTVDLTTIPLSDIEKIEVMHGPGSNLYGTGAMGGTVNIITRNPPKDKQETEFTTSFGTFRTYTERLVHGAGFQNFGYLVTGDYESSEGFRQNSAFNAKDFSLKLNYNPNNANTLSFNSGFYKSHAGAPGSITFPDKDDKQTNLNNFLDLNWAFNIDESARLTAKVYNNYDRLEFAQGPGTAKSIHTTQARGINLQLSKDFLNTCKAVGGINYVGNFNDSTTTAKHKYNVKAAYIEGHFVPFKDLNMSLGVRLDDYSNFGFQDSPSFTYSYKFLKNNKIHGLISRSFRAPTFNDLYWPDDGYTRGNPNLKPEKGTTFEMGVESQINKYIYLDVTYYRNIYNELINWAPDDLNVWMPTNIGSATIYGVEFKNKLLLTDNFGINIGYTFLSAKDSKTNKFLVYQPENKVDCSLKYENLKGFVCEFKAQYTGTRFHNTDNTVKVKRFVVLGLNVSKKFKHGLTYYASIENMLAKKYQVIRDYPMPGFSITNGLKLEF